MTDLLRGYTTFRAALVLMLGLTLNFSSSCVKAPIPNHPGAVNAVDNAIYDAILSTRAAIVTAQDQFKGDAKVMLMINQSVLPPFNRLEASYVAYHTSLASGKDPGPPTILQAQLDSVKQALAIALKGAVAPVPGPSK